MKKIKAIIATLLCAGFLVSGSNALAFNPLDSCDAASATASSCSVCSNAPSSTICKDKPTDNPITGPKGVIGRIAALVSYIVGAASIIMMVWGGFRYTKSNGEASKISDAKGTITYALVGVAVTASAATIASLIGTKLL